MAVAARNEAAYRQAVARLKAHPRACWKCGRPATTIDHVPALKLHRHRPRSSCCELRPACARCNYSGGARITAQLKRRKRTTTASRDW